MIRTIEKSKCLELNETFGINPALKNTYYDWYKNNEAIFIPAAGQIDNSRSHFLAQDILEYGINNSSFTLTTNTSLLLISLLEVSTNIKLSS